MPAWLAINYATGIPYPLMLCSKLLISSSSSHPALAPLSSLITPVITPRSSNFLHLTRPANEGPTACVKQVANFPLPSLLSNQSDTLTKARAAAAEGYLSPFTIPLLAEPETLVQPARLNWVLRFPLPPPNPLSNRRFSSTPSYHYGPLTPQALDSAIRYAANFSYDDPTPTHPQAAAFVQLPDPTIKFGDVRRPTTEPPLLLHRMSKPGYSQAPLDWTPRMSINFLGPIFPTSPPSLKAISLVTSAWINSPPPVLTFS